ncbi:MAG: CcmD family protein [Chlorobi bacterium]|nr:CcmD family protein [Chlorobiota bacterium]
MIDYLNQYPHVIVLLVTIVIWSGIALFVWRLDRKIESIEAQLTTSEQNNTSTKQNS